MLTEEENSLVSEKEKYKERIKLLNKQKESYMYTQNLIKSELLRLESNNIKHKLRGDILLKKLTDQTKYMNEINEQIYWSNENPHYVNEKLSYVTVSYIDAENLENDHEMFYQRKADNNTIKEKKSVIFKKKHRSYSVGGYSANKEKLSVEENDNFSRKNSKEQPPLSLLQEVKEETKKQNKLRTQLEQILKEEYAILLFLLGKLKFLVV